MADRRSPSLLQLAWESLLVIAAGALLGLIGAGLLPHRTAAPLLLAAGGALAVALALARRRQRQATHLRQVLESLPTGGVPAQGAPPGDEQLAARLEALIRREREMRLVAETVHGLEALFEPGGRLVWISPSVLELTGFTPEECLAAADFIDLVVHQTDRAYCHKQAAIAFEERQPVGFEFRIERRNGEVLWAACHWTPVAWAGDEAGALRVSAEPIQARKEAELRLLESVAEMRRARSLSEHYLLRTKDERQRLSAVLDAIRPGIVLMDTEQRVLYVNQAFLRLWRLPAGENLFGLRDTVLFARFEPQMLDPEAFRRRVGEVIAGGASPEGEFALRDGRIVTEASVRVTRESSEVAIGRVWIFEDVTAVRRSAELLQRQAERDALTGLFNRRRFDEELERAIAESDRRARQTGLLVFDLDGFKPVNDRFGHQAGDQVLVTLAEVLGRAVRRHEMLFRFGGDEFAILVPDSEDSHLQELARRVVDSVAGTGFDFGGGEVHLTASVGVACYPVDAASAERLVAAADAAMYRAKSGGKNRWAMSAHAPASAGGDAPDDRIAAS